MAHIVYRRSMGGLARQIIINGVDYSHEVYAEPVELVEVGDNETAEVGLRVTFAVSRLDLETDQDIQVTDHFPEVAQRVRSIAAPTD